MKIEDDPAPERHGLFRANVKFESVMDNPPPQPPDAPNAFGMPDAYSRIDMSPLCAQGEDKTAPVKDQITLKFTAVTLSDDNGKTLSLSFNFYDEQDRHIFFAGGSISEEDARRAGVAIDALFALTPEKPGA